jgi:hypothetical protein
MPEWSKLKTHHEDKRRSFEEFCYQAAMSLYPGDYTRIDDSGGGDGVEFFKTLPNGDEWGWQAKFYYPQERFNVSNRKKHIQQSLDSSCKRHPKLKKWILCTPTNLTDEESAWFMQELSKRIPTDMKVELEHWGDSEFDNWIREPRLAGIRNYFFGDLELTIDWFRRQFGKRPDSAKERFNPALHTEGGLDVQIKEILGQAPLRQEVRRIVEDLCDRIDEYGQALKELKEPIPYHIEWGTSKKEILTSLESYGMVVKDALAQVKEVRDSLEQHLFEKVETWCRTQANDVITKIYQSKDVCWKQFSAFDEKVLGYTGKEKERKQAVEIAIELVRSPLDASAEIADYFSTLSHHLSHITWPWLSILGDAGVGKTHLASHIVDERLEEDLPAILISGSRFSGDRPIEEQMKGILDIPASYSFHDFLCALDSAAKSYRTRIPLVIDGLNEAMSGGMFSGIWRTGLSGLVTQIEEVRNVALVTTCRKSYAEAIWPGKIPSHTTYLHGFDFNDVEAAIGKYFLWYKIKGDLTASSLLQFRSPIYLRVFCESHNAQRQQEKQVYVGEQTLFQVFETYLLECNRAICDRLNLHKSTGFVKEALDEIALHLWENNARQVSLEKLAIMVDGKPLRELKWDQSKTKALLDEGLLVSRDWQENEEAVSFTYDLMGGYLIACSLVEKEKSNIDQFLASERVATGIFGSDLKSLHPLYDDIARSLAVALPMQTERFLHDYEINDPAFSRSIEALFELPPSLVRKDCVDRVTKLFSLEENRGTLLDLASSTMTHTEHPLNALFWSKRLRDLSMGERDTSWTESVRKNKEHFESLVIRFEKTCRNRESGSDLTKQRCYLMAMQLMWVLTTTIPALRDKTTRALYWYGRWMPETFLELATSSLDINDPYVPERMLAVIYGVAMALQTDFADTGFVRTVLSSYGRKLYETMFRQDAPHATTHILARDYSRRTVEIALIHCPDLLTPEQRNRIRPPFSDGGIRTWGESEDKNERDYRNGNAPIHMDFGNYTIGQLVKDRKNYDFSHPEYKIVRRNIMWRIYDLGYSLGRFGEIDKVIQQTKWMLERESEGKTERYGKKYSWIAFFELAGSRQDQGLLPEDYADPRIPECDIDPSFPQDVQEDQVAAMDLLEDRSTSNEEWVSNPASPDISNYLVVQDICGEKGPWVLLDGLIRQFDPDANRECFIFPRGFLVGSADLKELAELLGKRKFGRDLLPEVRSDYYVYAGEIPWSDTFPPNGLSDMSIVITTRKEIRSIPMLAESGIVVKDQEVEVPDVTRNFAVYTPVRYNNYESYHSAVHSGRSVLVPAKEIAEALGLCSQPQTFDLYERNGRKASVTVQVSDTDQQLVFLRQDLLEMYLKRKDLSLLWACWGERQHRTEEEIIKYVHFSFTIEYPFEKNSIESQ